MRDVLTLILAGGKGTRLDPLTRDRAKPAVPFGGLYRIIDFTLSNCINSSLRRVLVLTQYKARSLDRHIMAGWGFLSRQLDEYIDVLPPQQRIDEHWYKGTADAIYQNIYTIEKADPRYVLILAGDHIYKMDYASLVEYHKDNRADLTVSALRAPASESRYFGVLEIDAGAARQRLQLDVAVAVLPAPAALPLVAALRLGLAGDGLVIRRMRQFEMHLRLEYESLSQMGDKGTLATTAALLARAIAAQGEKRYNEATELITDKSTLGNDSKNHH